MAAQHTAHRHHASGEWGGVFTPAMPITCYSIKENLFCLGMASTESIARRIGMRVEESLLKDAARVTVAFFFTFVWAVAIQAKQKYAAMAAHREAKKSDPKRIFNRYTDEAILSGDRAVGNYVEWMGAFLSLFWVGVFVVGRDVINAGWLYVAIRALYPPLAAAGGISKHGAKPLILVATLPGYASLGYMAYKISVAVM